MLLDLYLIYKTTATVTYTLVSSFCSYFLSSTIMGVSAASAISNIQDSSDCDLYTSKFIL